jgi:hypothetical protein
MATFSNEAKRMKVMVAYNGSTEAQAALAYGFKKADEMGGELIVFDILRRTYFFDMDNRLPWMEDAFQTTLRVKKDTLVHRSGRKIMTTFVFAFVDTSDDILRYAGQAQADLLVVPPEFEELLEKACCLVDVA